VARKGVAVVVIPGDVALQSTKAKPPAWIIPTPPVVRPSDPDLDKLATLLNSAKRVTLLCGAGCMGAHDQVVALAERLKSPIVHPLRGKEHIEYDNPF
jgi:pyruvate dehydrogenase (quinone)